jgi:hypothetical protein
MLRRLRFAQRMTGWVYVDGGGEDQNRGGLCCLSRDRQEVYPSFPDLADGDAQVKLATLRFKACDVYIHPWVIRIRTLG